MSGDKENQQTGNIIINSGTFSNIDFEAQNGDFNLKGGTITASKENTISGSGNVNLDGGTIKISEGGTLGIYKYEEDAQSDKTKLTAQMGLESVLDIAGTLNSNLNGNGTIKFSSNTGKISGDVTLTNGGMMDVGLNHAVIDGKATFQSGSTLQFEVSDQGNGSLTANTIEGQNGATLSLNITKKMEIGDEESVTLFEGRVSDNFTKQVLNNRYKVTTDDGKNYSITYENSASDVVYDANGSANNAGTAEAWDTMAQDSTANEKAKEIANVLNNLSQNNQQAYIDALTALAPETAPMVQQTQSETASQVFGAVGTRLTGGSVTGGRQGLSSGDATREHGAVWIQGLYNKSKLDNTYKSKGFDSKNKGMAAGIEAYINDATKLGIGYAYTNTDIDGFMRNTDVDSHTAILYGEYKPNNWYVNGIATYGWSKYDEKKNVSNTDVKADYDVNTFGLQAMTGYDIYVNGAYVTPEVGLRYLHMKQDSYKDTSDQEVSGSNTDLLTGVVGTKVSQRFGLHNGISIRPEARIAATYDLLNDDVASTVTLANGTAYNVKGEALNRFGVEAGAGVTAELDSQLEIFLGYEGKFRKDYQDHTGLINAKYKF